MHHSLQKVRRLQSFADSTLKFNFPGHWPRCAASGGLGAVRTFASVGHLQEEIVDALRLGQRSKASNLLSELGHTTEALKANAFLPILRCCARLPDPLFASETWKFMEEKNICRGGKCYFYTFQALCKGGYLKEASNLMRFLEENPAIYPLLPVCNDFLRFCGQTDTANHVNDCLDFMERQMVGKNEVTYILLLKLAVLHKNLPAVHEIWKECIQYYRLNIISLRRFIWSFTKLRDLDSACTALQQMVDMALRGNFVIPRTTGGKLSILSLDIPIPSSGNVSLQHCIEDDRIVPSIFEYQDRMDENASRGMCNFSLARESKDFSCARKIMPVKHVNSSVKKLLRWSFNDVLHACANMQNGVLAEQLMSQIQKLGLKLSGGTYDGFLRAVVAPRGFDDGMKVLEVMQQKDLKPYDSTLAAMSVSCSKALQLDLAEAFLNQISTCSTPFPYNAFFKACDTLDRPERAIPMLAKMKKLNIQQDIKTYELLFKLFGNVNVPYEEGNMFSREDVARRVNAIEMDMRRNGIPHSHATIKNLLKALGSEGMVKELLQSFSVYNCLGTEIYNIVLHSLVQAAETSMAVKTFKTMKSCGVPSDASTYVIMIGCCSIMKCFRSACALVSMMIRDGFIPETVTYTTVIKTLLKLEDFDEALKLLNQMKLNEVEPDLLLYNTVIKLASEKGEIDVVEIIVEQMHQEKIQPDPSTCHYVFSAYVDQGFHNTAMEALQVLSMRMISEDDDIREEKLTEYGNLIVSEVVDCEAQIMLLFQESMDSVPFALLQLRWCAMLGLPLSWLPNQSPWATRLSHKYASGTLPQ